MSRNTQTAVAGIKLGIFAVVSVLVTGLLAVIMGNFSFTPHVTFRAHFTTASMLQKGDDVRIAGIPVGEVESVEIHRRNQAMVTFNVEDDVPMTTASRAEIRYLNLVGDRYLALVEGSRKAPALEDGATLGLDRTTPALNLTELFNGFQPLFAALDPEQVNELSLNLVQVLQGEGGTVRGLLAETASLTNSLADRDQLIGEVVDNLNRTLGTVSSRREQLGQLVTELEGWMTGLARDRKALGGSIQSMSELTETVADLLTRSRPLIEEDVEQLRRLMTTLNRQQNKRIVLELLQRLPEALSDQTRIGTYGSWYNYYLCDFKGRITLPKIAGVDLGPLQQQLNDLSFHSTAPRCE